MPMMVFPSAAKNSFGAYEASVAILITPDDLIDAGSMAFKLSLEDPLETGELAVELPEVPLLVVGAFLLEQPVTTSTMVKVTTPATRRGLRNRRRVTRAS